MRRGPGPSRVAWPRPQSRDGPRDASVAGRRGMYDAEGVQSRARASARATERERGRYTRVSRCVFFSNSNSLRFRSRARDSRSHSQFSTYSDSVTLPDTTPRPCSAHLGSVRLKLVTPSCIHSPRTHSTDHTISPSRRPPRPPLARRRVARARPACRASWGRTPFPAETSSRPPAVARPSSPCESTWRSVGRP